MIDLMSFIRQQVAFIRMVYDGALADITDEQFNWTPPGTANPIRAALLHLLNSEDFFLQTVAQGKPRLWERGGWAEKIGLQELPGRGRNWEPSKETILALAPVLAYGQEVHTASDEYLAGLTDEELGREVRFFGSQRPVSDVLATLVTHSMGHLGEIATVRGMQGVKGLPF